MKKLLAKNILVNRRMINCIKVIKLGYIQQKNKKINYGNI